MSYTVADRSHEIGIRMTIGAEPKQILWLVMSHALKLAAISLAIGTAGDLLASRLLEGFLYGVEPTDPITFIAVCGILVVVVMIDSGVNEVAPFDTVRDDCCGQERKQVRCLTQCERIPRRLLREILALSYCVHRRRGHVLGPTSGILQAS